MCACREMVNAWFAERCHSIQPSSREGSRPQTEFCPLLPDPPPSPSPSPSTPTRKISASEFDRPLRPIVVKDAEGAFTFLSDTEHVQMPLRTARPEEGGAGGTGPGQDTHTHTVHTHTHTHTQLFNPRHLCGFFSVAQGF